MLATQPVVDASRPSFEVGEDLVDPRQDEVSGGVPDDMDIVAIGGDRSVAGPAVGFRDGVGIGGGFRRSVRGRRRRRRRFRPAAGRPGMFPSPSSMAPTMSILPSWLRPCPPVGGSSLVRKWKAGLVDFHQARQRVALGVDHAGAQLVGEQPSAAVRADTELFLELQGRDAVGVGRHQVGGPEPDGERQLAGVQDRPGRHRGLPAGSRRTRRCVLFCAAPIPFHGRTRDRRSRPASAFRSARRRRRHRPGTMCWKARRLSGTCFMWWLRLQKRIGNILPVPPHLTSTSTSGGKLSRPEPCA